MIVRPSLRIRSALLALTSALVCGLASLALQVGGAHAQTATGAITLTTCGTVTAFTLPAAQTAGSVTLQSPSGTFTQTIPAGLVVSGAQGLAVGSNGCVELTSSQSGQTISFGPQSSSPSTGSGGCQLTSYVAPNAATRQPAVTAPTTATTATSGAATTTVAPYSPATATVVASTAGTSPAATSPATTSPAATSPAPIPLAVVPYTPQDTIHHITRSEWAD